MIFTTLTLAVALLASVHAQLRIETPPSLVTCQPAAITWDGGVTPYYISVIPAGQVSAAAIEQFPQQTSTRYTWTVDLPAESNITLSLRDGNGDLAYSSPSTIVAGPDTSCIDADAAASYASAATPATTAAATVTSVASAGTIGGSPDSGVTSTITTTSSGTHSGTSTTSSNSTPAHSSSPAASSTGAGLVNAQAGGGTVAFFPILAALLGLVL